jgi:hypothetical protein
MKSKQSNDRKTTRQDSQKKLDTNGIDQSVSPNHSARNKNPDPKRQRQDLSLFEALVECATREESSGTLSDDDAGIHPIYTEAQAPEKHDGYFSLA